MFASQPPISDAEKIDYIYRTLKNEKRNKTAWLAIKLLIFAIILFGVYYFTLPAQSNTRKSLFNMFQTNISAIVTPIVGNIIGSMLQNQGGGLSLPQDTSSNTSIPASSSSSAPVQHRNVPKINITPQMVEQVQNAINQN